MGEALADRIRRTFEASADAPAIEEADGWVLWRDVRAFADRLNEMLAAAGAATGRIGIVIRNRPAHAAAAIGLLAAGRSISFLYPFSPPDEIARQIAALGDVPILLDEEDATLLSDAIAVADITVIALPTQLADGPRLVTHAIDAAATPEAEAGVEVLSSGTTGPPKRLPMPMHLLERAVASAPGAEAGTVPPVQINVWPLGGVGGLCLLVAAAVSATPLVLIDRFSVAALVEAIRRHRPATLGLPPTAIRMLFDADVPPEDLASVQVISGGSAALDPDLQDAFEDRYDCVILWAIGATEFCGTIVRWTPELRAAVGRSKRGSVGKAMPGVSLRVVDPDTGVACAAGEDGLLEVLCPAVRDGWVRTTDLVSIDADGFVFHRGRRDGAIVRGGFKILPERLVTALCAHPAVADAAVIGLADERLGAVPAAAVELKPGARISEPELVRHLRGLLPPTHVPSPIRILDALPRTPSMKVSLAQVRALLDADRGGASPPPEPSQRSSAKRAAMNDATSAKSGRM